MLQCDSMIQDIVSIVSCIFAFFTICFGLCQYKRANAIKRASYVCELIDKLKDDVDIRDTIYLFQYDNFHYDENFHNGSDLEIKIDKTLQYLDYICYLKYKNIINNEEFKFFEIDICMVVENKNLQNYLYNLLHFEWHMNKWQSIIDAEKSYSFNHLLRYTKSHNVIEESFFDKNSYKVLEFHKYLNF